MTQTSELEWLLSLAKEEMEYHNVNIIKMLQKVDDQLVLDSRRLDSKRASPSTSSSSYLDNDTSENLLDKASEAFEKEDFDEYEYLLTEAYYMNPSKLMLLFIDQVQSHRNNQKNGNSVQHFHQSPTKTKDEGRFYGTRQEAVKCVAKAEELFNNGELDRAENLFLKAHRMLKQTTDTELTEHAQNMLKRVNIEKENKLKVLANNENHSKLDGLKNSYSRTSYQGSGATYRNKDEAEKCIKIAEEDFVASRLAKAERFLLKAERMYPTVRAKDLLRQIADVRAKGVKDTEERMPNEYNKASTRQQADVRKGQNSKTDTYASNIEQGPTQQDIEAIQRIETANSDFKILGVQRGCSHVEARKSFIRISKLVHSDRNRAPGASEAFMKLQRAYNRLQAQINQ